MILDQSMRAALSVAFSDVLMNAGSHAAASINDLVDAAAVVLGAFDKTFTPAQEARTMEIMRAVGCACARRDVASVRVGDRRLGR